MTEEQKRFKILARESYEKQISQANKKIISGTFFCGLFTATAILLCSTAAAVYRNIDTVRRLVYLGIVSLNTVSGAYNFKKLIESIVRKTNLQIRVEDIDRELEMFGEEEEESKGRGR